MNLRRMRGIVGTIVVWGISGAAIGVVLEGIASIVRQVEGRDGPWLAIETFQQAAGFWGAIGAAMGLGFALVLWCATRGRTTLSALSLHRVAKYGAVAGVATSLSLLSLITGGTLPSALVLGVYVVVGAGVGIGASTGSVAIARARPPLLGEAANLLPPAT
jgi:hypothetical protein